MFRAAAAVATCLALLAFGRSSSLALSTGLPDGRAYELVSRYTENGLEKGLDGELPNFALAATSGDAVDWEGVGGCCGAGSGAVNLYRSRRTPEGWQTGALTPAPPQPLSGFFAGQEPVFFTGDLSQTIFTTPAPYSEGVRRPAGSHANDLYLQGPDGRLTWLSQGGTGTGEGPYSAELDAATPDASTVVFSSAEPLTGDASGLKELNYPPQYLYLRDHLGDVYAEATTLVDVKEGQLISPYGGILGAGGWLKEELLPPDYQGTSTHALSENGEKAFFESPPPRTELEGAGRPHLFMRDLELEPPTVEQPRTVEIDDASSGGEARYEGAAADGSLVFFTSNEELAGASSANELYEFNTTSRAIGPDQPMSVLAIGGDEGVTGVTAIADDGSAVYFVATAKLPAPGPLGAEAQAGQPNLYRYETATGTTSFLATLSWPDVNQCEPDCGHGHPAGLVAEPDVDRPAYTTSQPSLPGHQPGGSVLAFTAYANLTGVQGQAAGAAAVLAAEAHTGEHTLAVSSTAGFAAGQHIAIG
ncbi:MAG TPA: hypothetical protein VMG62_00595, partial [Solirubrobacteraceae bacterium]|nr:hypothetical protein [Solirubrobacteraceae bacterium]